MCNQTRIVGPSYQLAIYVATHCEICRHSREVAAAIDAQYPHVDVQLIDVEANPERMPEFVFATPTYVLNGKVWSLGNPSAEKIQAAFA